MEIRAWESKDDLRYLDLFRWLGMPTDRRAGENISSPALSHVLEMRLIVGLCSRHLGDRMENPQEILPGVTALCAGPHASEHYVLFLNRLNAADRSPHIHNLLFTLKRLGRFIVSLDAGSIGEAWRNSQAGRPPSSSAYPSDIIEQVMAIKAWLGGLTGKHVIILSQSRGGIVAALSESCEPVSWSACFGYPFELPGAGAEPYRIDALNQTTKPFLIIQGTRDEYGGKEARDKYALPANVRMNFYETDHGFINMDSDSSKHMERYMLDLLTRGPL